MVMKQTLTMDLNMATMSLARNGVVGANAKRKELHASNRNQDRRTEKRCVVWRSRMMLIIATSGEEINKAREVPHPVLSPG